MNKEFIEKLKNFFKSKPVLKAYLFGSIVRNESDENSDVDILVELDYSRPIGLGFVKMHLELEALLDKKVDLLTSKSVSKHILPFIENEKVLVYER
jgi:predicted nucleotidyltransferase